MGLGRCRLLLFFQVAKFTNDSHFSNCPPSLNPVVKQETEVSICKQVGKKNSADLRGFRLLFQERKQY